MWCEGVVVWGVSGVGSEGVLFVESLGEVGLEVAVSIGSEGGG